MKEQKNCRTCGNKLVVRETQKKPSQLKKVYYYTAYFYCPSCQKIYHDDKFKVENKQAARSTQLVDKDQIPFDKNQLLPATRHELFDVEIWTDGACVFNGQHNARAAWAFVSGKTEVSGRVPGEKQTNNVAEGLAILKALEWAVSKNFRNIKLYTDSQISLYNLSKPANYVKQNREIFQKIEGLIKANALIVQYEKVLGHSGDENNERADRLANELAGKSY